MFCAKQGRKEKRRREKRRKEKGDMGCGGRFVGCWWRGIIMDFGF